MISRRGYCLPELRRRTQVRITTVTRTCKQAHDNCSSEQCAQHAPEACSGCLAVRRAPDGFLELRWAAPGDLTADPRVDKASRHMVIPQPSFVNGLPQATRLRIHTPRPLDEKLAYISAYAHGAEAVDLYCEAPHVPDLEQRLVRWLAPAFATLRRGGSRAKRTKCAALPPRRCSPDSQSPPTCAQSRST